MMRESIGLSLVVCVSLTSQDDEVAASSEPGLIGPPGPIPLGLTP